MEDRRRVISTFLMVILLMIATGFVVHVVDVFNGKTNAQQRLMLFSAVAGGAAILGLVLLVVLGWLMGFHFSRKH